MAVVTRDQLEASLAALVREVRDAREGILGPRSVAWQLGGDLGVFLGGGRAALLQLAHPMVAYAIDHHSRTRADVVGRFQRTFRHMFAMVFGELGDALFAARRVHAIHSRIRGTISQAVGAYPAGARYEANEVSALRWVHATLVDTTIAVRERLEGPVPVALKDRYIVELHRFGALFGLPAAELPGSWAAHERYMAEMLGTDAIAVAPCAREMARFLVGRGGPGPQPPLGRLLEAVTCALLPRHLVRGFGLADPPMSAAGVRLGLAAFAPFYRALPRRVVAIPARSEAVRRLAGKSPSRVAAWTERHLFGLSGRVTGSSPGPARSA